MSMLRSRARVRQVNGRPSDAAARPQPLLELLRCPETGQRLVQAGGELVAVDGSRRYPLVEGVPVLIAEGRSLFAGKDVRAMRPSPGRLRSELRRRLTASPASRRNFERLAELIREGWRVGEPPRRVLVIGGAVLGFGADALLGKPWIELVETDVYLGSRTRVVCDGHDLPFENGAFEAVVCQAVIEHVADPQRVVRELHRVLGQRGLVYSEAPFMQQVHEEAYDFTRWTMTGHRRLFRYFDEIDSGPVGGPGEALVWSLLYFAAALFNPSPPVQRLLHDGINIAGVPLRWLDRRLHTRPAAIDAASGTYLLGRRRSTPRPDSEIVAMYRGANTSPARCT